ncbi:MAG: 30S ribosomal protein S16 [Candidatus Magasanikbacteria bacterium CG_4_10_14_0_2_um_filter_37_12]|uniref:Small ribosomal subunit protein bS16 n=1 Tax=Candidatus Magasanikbacteria bacterium CG_4_10_14_0_2_um_filter_37_12 TaxID=1974637 RepID=A0A2M7V9C3_9BACT|nr:MAG: 30S ribosomal protein S16 [Candidatus Magasanikbacteria bacterium CG_4_10_14_0_2_um_filter_37_12]
MLMIRLQRLGRKKSPSYRLVVSEKARDPQAKSLEILGHYNPVAIPKIVELKEDRIKFWLAQGAQLSESVNNLFVNAGIVTGAKLKSVAISNKRQAKIDKIKAEKVVKEKKVAEVLEPAKEQEVVVDEKAPAEELAVPTTEEKFIDVVEDLKDEVAPVEEEKEPEAETPAEEKPVEVSEEKNQ